MSLTATRRIGLFVRPDLLVKREFLSGVARALRINADWEPLMLAPENRSAAYRVPAKLDGVIAWLDVPDDGISLRAIEAPVIFVGHVDPGRVATRICFDNVGIGRLVATTLLDRGFRNFAYRRQQPSYAYGSDRLRGYRERLAEAGIHNVTTIDADETGAGDNLAACLHGLPAPTGIFCETDRSGIALLRACHQAGVRVPEDVAVIGVGNDDLLCALTHPPMSSVSLRGEAVGRLAVEMLEARMRDPKTPPATQMITDFRVVERASSELLAIEDRAVATVLRIIRERAGAGIGIAELASAASLSRRMLEIRFKAVTGRTMHDEIVRVRLLRAQTLLEETDLSITEVAERCGYSESPRLCEDFSRTFSLSPRRWRLARRAARSEGKE